MVLERAIGPHLFKYYVEAGARGPLHAGAPGKTMLAWLPEEELQRMLTEMPLVRVTGQTIQSREALERELAEVREKGYAMDRGETLEGLFCLGAPVWDAAGRVCASVWITAPAPRLDEASVQRDAPLVIEAGRRVGAALR